MKIYDFNILCWSVVVTLGFFMLFIFGLIWLNKGFEVQDMIYSSERRQKETLAQHTLERQMEIQNIKESIGQLQAQIMPSCFRGRM